jgi:hypothetical protein
MSALLAAACLSSRQPLLSPSILSRLVNGRCFAPSASVLTLEDASFFQNRIHYLLPMMELLASEEEPSSSTIE